MKNRTKILLSILSTSILLNGCNIKIEDSNNNSSEDTNIIIQSFEKDEYTKKINKIEFKQIIETENTESSNNENTDIKYEDTLSKISLIGEDKSILYEIVDNANIVYRDTTFKNLYTNIYSINTKYNKNTLLNFIIKTYKAKSTLIDTVLCNDINEINTVLNNEEIKNKYGETVSWMIKFIDTSNNQEIKIYGTDSYILIPSDGIDRNIDMTEYDISLGVNIQDNQEENPEPTEENPEPTGENPEPTGENPEPTGDSLNLNSEEIE